MVEGQEKDRIVETKDEISRFLDLFLKIEELLRNNERVIIGIDGNSAGGKTTLAKALQDIYNADVIHMDDFFLPANFRTDERLNEVGGNIHYERFMDEVISKIKESELVYGVFDCSTMNYGMKKRIRTKPMLIVEGVYSLHPKFIHIYDLKVFLSVSQKDQKSRILDRSDGDKLRRYETEWLPMENKYFDELEVYNKCDFRF